MNYIPQWTEYEIEKMEKQSKQGAYKSTGLMSSLRQEEAKELVLSKDMSPHLIVDARAGCGKSTTIIEAMKLLRGVFVTITPSQQQKAIWDQIYLSEPHAKSIGFVAFNKAIADELKDRVPVGCDALTMHAMGLANLTRAFPWMKNNRELLNEYRVYDIIVELTEMSLRDLQRYQAPMLGAVVDLVKLCKQTMVGTYNPMLGMGVTKIPSMCDKPIPYDTRSKTEKFESYWNEELTKLAREYDIDISGYEEEVFALVPKVLKRCMDLKDRCIDYADMVWLPIVLNIPIYKYDLLLVDEAQDLARCQQELALRSAHRMVLIGDPKQAIYNFAGADSKSMERMHIILGGNVGEPASGQRGCVVLPLTVTRRCGRAIVREAQKIVPDFEAHESNCEGKVGYLTFENKPNGNQFTGSYHSFVQDGDLIICRCNAPLVQQCFRFLRQDRKAFIQGRDIGAGLIRTIKKLKAISVVDLFAKLEEWYLLECQKENARVHPSDQRLIALSDKKSCIQAMCEGATTVDGVISNINGMFHDDKRGVGIELSSIHQAKGRERKRVFFLMPEHARCPHPLAKTPMQKEQERNLLYVGITRAIEELYYVS